MPIFCKPHPVPFAPQEDLAHGYQKGIARGVWKPVQFNDYGTPAVPIKKSLLPGQSAPSLRVCGDYSVTVYPQLETHRQPIPIPEELMRKSGGGYGFTNIDLADAYNQIPLSPESQKRLALSTQRSAPANTSTFWHQFNPGIFSRNDDPDPVNLRPQVYLDDILVSGDNAEDHLHKLRQLLQRLQNKGLGCRLEKCFFAQPRVEYLGHTLSHSSVAKISKVDAALSMPQPHDPSSLKSFLGSVQFYSKFLPNLATITEPLYMLTRKNVDWRWGARKCFHYP